MLAILGLVLGLAGGAAGATAWLLGGAPPEAPMPDVPVPVSLQARLDLVKSRLDAAIAEGKAAGAATENRLRHELETYRRHPDRPGISSTR